MVGCSLNKLNITVSDYGLYSYLYCILAITAQLLSQISGQIYGLLLCLHFRLSVRAEWVNVLHKHCFEGLKIM